VNRIVFLVVVGAVCLASAAHANPCTDGSLASYEALGAGGCTIGTNLISSFGTLSGTTGATELPAGDVMIDPSGGTSNPELMFSVTQTAATGELLETIFTYQISGNPYILSEIDLSNSSETVDGAVTDIQNLCADGSFGPDGVSGCSGTPASLLTLDGIQNTDQTSLAALGFVSVTDDFTLDGGTAGSAMGGTFTDQFQTGTTTSTVPEPRFDFLIVALALGSLALYRRPSIRR
jgi:hypothetical protein